MSQDKGPLSERGKAAEDRWARDQDRQAIEKLKQKDGTEAGKGCGCGDSKKSGTCADHATTDKKDCCKKKKNKKK